MVNASFEVVAIADKDPARFENLKSLAKNLEPSHAHAIKKIKLTSNSEDIINDPKIEAVAIATPATTHYLLAASAIAQGKHVLVEKPLCTRTEEGRDLIHRAESRDVTLMVDHTILMTPAVRKIREVCSQPEFGQISYFDATRINLGLFQKDVNVLWDLAPHDFSVLDYLFDEDLVKVEASGFAHLNPKFPDIVYLTMHFASNKIAHFNFSWMSPIKMRHVVIGGTRKMLVWDDLKRTQKIKIYDCGITYPKSRKDEVVLPEYRKGLVFAPKLSRKEALTNVVQHFAQVIKGNEKSLMDGYRGLRVVQMLEQSQKVLDKSLVTIQSLRGEPKHAIPEFT